MRTNITKLLVISCAFSWSVQGRASASLSKDQASNVARQKKEPQTPLDIKFSSSGKQGTGPVKKLEGENVNFTLKGINLIGNEIFSTSELARFWQSYLNKYVSMAEIQKIAQDMVQHYREQGYELAQVILPVQNIDPKQGKINLQILEGVLGSVKVEGGGPGVRKLVEDQLKHLPVGKPFNTNILERRLLNIRKTPGVTIQLVLVPSTTTFGNTDLVLKIGKQRYLDVALGENNTGNKYVGMHRVSADATAYNLIGRSKLALSHLHSTRKDFLDFNRVRHTQLIGDHGTRAYVEYMASRARPRIPYLNKSSYKYANIMLMHPLIYKRDQNLRIRFALDGQNDVSTYEGTTLKNDHIRAARLGLLYSQASEVDFWEVSAILSKGFNREFGARKTLNPSRAAGRNDFRHATGRGSWTHKINNYFSLYNMVGWQYSLDPLLATEEFAVGASNYARGYDSTETTADTGLGGLAEIRLNTPSPVSWINSIQFYTSLGGARVRNPKQKTINTKQENLSSVAVGVRGSVFDCFSYSFQSGRPLSRRSSMKHNKKWDYTATFGLNFALSKDWNKDVQALADPLDSIEE